MKYYKFENQLYKADFEKNLIHQYSILNNGIEANNIIPPSNNPAEVLIETWKNLCEEDFVEISEEQYTVLEELFKQKKLVTDNLRNKISVELDELQQKLNEI